jgi:imidazoleglycerol-phosphate dehydratase
MRIFFNCVSETAMRQADVSRNTLETRIRVAINLDGTGVAKLATGVGFFDHMLDQIARHGMMDLIIDAAGDLHIDAHHTVEDVGITFGQALAKALGDKKGLRRYVMRMCRWMRPYRVSSSICLAVRGWYSMCLLRVR